MKPGIILFGWVVSFCSIMVSPTISQTVVPKTVVPKTVVPKTVSNAPTKQQQEKPAFDVKQLESAAEALIAATKDENTNIRIASLQLLGRSSVLSQKVAEALKVSLWDPDENVAGVAFEAFSRLQCDNAIKLKILIRMIDSDDQNKVEIASQLMYVLPAGEKTVLEVANLLKDENISRKVKRQLFTVLQRWSSQAAPASKVLAEMYDANQSWKIQILTTLRTIGPGAKLALPTITKAIRDKEANVRLLAVQTMESVLSPPLRSSRAVRSRSASSSRVSFDAYTRNLISKYDANRDGIVTTEEGRTMRNFSRYDMNRDGRVTFAEISRSLNGTRSASRSGW